MNALQAGVMNVPFVPVRGLLYTDYMKIRPDFKRMANPYDPDEEIALVPAIAPDVAVFHGLRGDRSGNVVASGTLDAKLIAQAARRTIATVEELAETSLADEPHADVLVPGIHVDAVVHAPRGAHPTACAGHYDDDGAHIREYMEAAGGDETFAAYLRHYVLDSRDHAEYLGRVTAARAAAAPVVP
jgi:glutaconate CoA-transferase subunit A